MLHWKVPRIRSSGGREFSRGGRVTSEGDSVARSLRILATDGDGKEHPERKQ